MKNISVCLWYDKQAEQAAEFYKTVFNTQVGTIAKYSEAASQASGQPKGSVMTVDMKIEGLSVLALNGGPMFKFNPSSSFTVACTSKAEIEEKWKKLSQGGQVRMGLDKYPWAEAYGWTTDQFGVEWQLIFNPEAPPAPRKISPAFLFTDELFGKGQQALDLYTSIFPNSKIETIAKDEKTNSVMHARFNLNGESFVLMEGQGKHGHKFNEAFSLMVSCENQQEIDAFWNKLTANGGSPSRCGWCKDPFGVSWQIVWSGMGETMKDPAKAGKAMAVVMKMGKLDIAKIKEAAES